MLRNLSHLSASSSKGNGPTQLQGERKTLTRVGFEPTTYGVDHRFSPIEAQGQNGDRASVLSCYFTAYKQVMKAHVSNVAFGREAMIIERSKQFKGKSTK